MEKKKGVEGGEKIKRRVYVVEDRLNQYQEGEGLRDVVDYFFPTRKDYPPKARKILKNLGVFKVKEIYVGRNPIQSYVTKLLNVLTLGKLEDQKKKMAYDDLYHLYMIVVLDTGFPVLVEKNSVINIQPVPTSYKDKAESIIKVPINKVITFGDMMNKTQKDVGESFFKYDHVNNNCQYFVMNILKSNGLLTKEANDFIMQNILEVLKTSPTYASTIARLATETSAKLDRLFYGAGKGKKK